MSKIFIALLSLLIVRCGKSLCENKLIHEISSPKKTYAISVFERSCGVTTPVINVVNVRKTNNVLDLENYQNWVFTAHGQSTIDAIWKSDNEILISYSTSDPNPTKITALDDVKITFVTKEK